MIIAGILVAQKLFFRIGIFPLGSMVGYENIVRPAQEEPKMSKETFLRRS